MRSPGKLINIGISLVIVGLLIPLLAYAVTCYIPREYTSTATIVVEPNQLPITSIRTDPGPETPPPHYLEDQIEVIKSGRVLLPAIEELGLQSKWSAGSQTKLTPDEAYQRLLRMIRVFQTANPKKASISVTGTDKQEAADIANTVAVIYDRMRFTDFEKALFQGEQEEADKSFAYMEATEADLKKIRTRENVREPSPDDDPDFTSPDATLPKQLPEDYANAKQEYLKARKSCLAAQQKLAIDKMDFNDFLPFVTAWDRAVPATSPSSPDVPLIMKTASAIGGVFVLCGLGLIAAGVRLKRHTLHPTN